MFGRIEKDDESCLDNLDSYNISQIDSFLKYAIEKGSTKCIAALMSFKNEHFSDYAEIEEFTLNF